ncbi:MAG: iron ABC transporter permease [Actinobacteria bacterium]|nr:MAG: iron ABC transporter permease [Actinomycetota bacterium]
MARRVDHNRSEIIMNQAVPSNISQSMYKRSARWLWVAPTVFLVLVLIVPTAVIINRGATFDGFGDVLNNSTIKQALWFTAWQALASTVLTVIVALPATFVLSRFSFIGNRALQALITVPFLLPTVVVGAAFLAVLPSRLHYTAAALIIAHAYFNLTVVVRIVGARWEQLHPGIEQAARTLGARPMTVFRTVTLPLLRSALAAACGVIGLFAFTSYGIVRTLGGPARSTIETEIYTRSVLIGDMPGAIALSILQLVVLTTALWWWAKRHSHQNVNPQISIEHRPPNTRGQIVLVYGTALATAAVVIAPITALLWRSLARTSLGRSRFTLAGWRAVASPATLSSLSTSAQFAICTMVIATTLGLMVALGVAYGAPKFVWLERISVLPLTVSAVTIGLGILITFDTAPYDFRSAWIITPLAHSLIALPLVVRIVLPVVRQIPRGLQSVASTLGATPLRTWLTVDRPLISRAIGASAAIAFAISIGEFGATSFLTRRGNETLPVTISRLLSRPGDALRTQAYALCVIVVVISMIAIFVIDMLRTNGKAK